MRNILDHLVDSLSQGQYAVVGGVVRSSGSAPRASGAWMLVRPDGSLVGSVGGGVMEGACLKKAGYLLQGEESSALLRFSLGDRPLAEAGMLCGGNVEVALAKVAPEQLPFFRRLQERYRIGACPLLLVFLPEPGQPLRLSLVDDIPDDEVPNDLRREVLRRNVGKPFLLTAAGREVFVEPLVHPGTVHLVGAGHVAMATARLAAFAGFATTVMDDRPEFCNRERFPQVDKVRVLSGFSGCVGELGPADYLIIATRGHHSDREVLSQALNTAAGYIGMIGSRRKRETIYASLRDQGFRGEDLERVHCPIGLSIGAETPEEIAVSIVAELVQVRAAGVAS